MLCGFINYQVVLKNGFLILNGSTRKAGRQTSCAFLISPPSVSSSWRLWHTAGDVSIPGQLTSSWQRWQGSKGPKQKGLLFLKWEKEARVFWFTPWQQADAWKGHFLCADTGSVCVCGGGGTQEEERRPVEKLKTVLPQPKGVIWSLFPPSPFLSYMCDTYNTHTHTQKHKRSI